MVATRLDNGCRVNSEPGGRAMPRDWNVGVEYTSFAGTASSLSTSSGWPILDHAITSK